MKLKSGIEVKGLKLNAEKIKIMFGCDKVGREGERQMVECNPGQVVNTHVPLSPSSIIWYQPMGGDALRLGR